jgi:hypothetical protein
MACYCSGLLGLDLGWILAFHACIFVDVMQFQADAWAVHEVGYDIILNISSPLFTEPVIRRYSLSYWLSSLNRPHMMGMVDCINSTWYRDEGRVPVSRLTKIPISLKGGEWPADRLLGFEQSCGFESLITEEWVISLTVVWYAEVYAGKV